TTEQTTTQKCTQNATQKRGTITRSLWLRSRRRSCRDHLVDLAVVSRPAGPPRLRALVLAAVAVAPWLLGAAPAVALPLRGCAALFSAGGGVACCGGWVAGSAAIGRPCSGEILNAAVEADPVMASFAWLVAVLAVPAGVAAAAAVGCAAAAVVAPRA